jgi:bifunctional DNA-binding transcriptional regulator/antitoxin component of YhaV-PrlF toxin-antitoxin module
MLTKTLFIGPKGQITIPKKIRDLFKTNTIVIEILDNTHAVITPAPDVAGAIAEFRKKTNLTFDEIRNNAWIKSTRVNNNNG